MAMIVLAEDDAHIRRIVSMWLKKYQHTVLEAPNGRKALELMEDRKPDILVTDVNMPTMTGIELVKMAAERGMPRLGVVMLTSRCDQKEIGAELEGFGVRLHPKPFSPTGLIQEVNELLAQSHSGREPQPAP